MRVENFREEFHKKYKIKSSLRKIQNLKLLFILFYFRMNSFKGFLFQMFDDICIGKVREKNLYRKCRDEGLRYGYRAVGCA